MSTFEYLESSSRWMESWQSGPCEHCGGTIVDKRVDLHRKIRGQYYILIEDIPAGVCTLCGARFYRADVLDHIEEIIRSPEQTQRNIQVPVYSLVSSPGMVLGNHMSNQPTTVHHQPEKQN